MKHFSRLSLKAYIFILSHLILRKTDATIIKANLPSIPAFARFLNEFIRPIIENHSTPKFRADTDKSFIKNIIHNKIKQLKPVLQDHDINEEFDTVTLEGEEDTHILEFIPSSKQALRYKNHTADVEKFKKMQKKIKKALNKEPISEDTKKFITKSVDEMVAHIVSNKCVWTSAKAALRLGNEGDRKPFTFNHMWSHLLNKIQTRYKESDKGTRAKNKHNLKQLQQFVSEILNDTQTLSEDYRVVCSVVNINNLNVTGLRTLKNNEVVVKSKQPKNPHGLRASEITLDKKDIDENETCPYFKVCSEELSDFMTDFHINLNDTAVRTLTNYAAMFVRDVKKDHSNEKQTVIKLINETSYLLPKKINIIFKKQTEKFNLDKNKDKASNINSLRQYIRKTVNHVKRQVTNDIALKLQELRPKLRLTVEKDIDVNLDVDLGNLERELSAKICMVFEICNGKYVSRRNIDYGRPKIDKNHLFVRVQLTLDDKKKPDRKIAVGVGQAMKANGLSTFYDKHVSITRTNAPSTITNSKSARTDTLFTKTEASSTTSTMEKQTTYHGNKLFPEKSTNPQIIPANIVLNKVKLTSAEIVKNTTAKMKHKKHEHYSEAKFKDNRDSHSKIKIKNFKTIKSLETYHQTRMDVFTDKISTHTEKTITDSKRIVLDKNNHMVINISSDGVKTYNYSKTDLHAKIEKHLEKKHREKKHRVTKHKATKYNNTSTTKFKKIESLETYRENQLESLRDKSQNNTVNISKYNITIHQHTKKKKNHVKKYHGSKKHKHQKKDNTKNGETVRLGKSGINLDKKEEHHKSRDKTVKTELGDILNNIHHKKHNTKNGETVHADKSGINLDKKEKKHKSQVKTVKTELGDINNNINTEKVHQYIKPNDLIGNQGATDVMNMTEFKFNMTLGTSGVNTDHHVEKHHKSKKHKDLKKGGKENKKRNKETNSEKMFYKRSRDVNDTESYKANGTQIERKEERRFNNDTFDDIIKSHNFEEDDDYYYYDDYENSTEIYHSDYYDGYESENYVNNEIESFNKKHDDVKVYHVKSGTFVELDDKRHRNK